MLLFTTDQWQRLVPTSWEVFPNALSTQGCSTCRSTSPPMTDGFATTVSNNSRIS